MANAAKSKPILVQPVWPGQPQLGEYGPLAERRKERLIDKPGCAQLRMLLRNGTPKPPQPRLGESRKRLGRFPSDGALGDEPGSGHGNAGRPMVLVAPVPADFTALLTALRQAGGMAGKMPRSA